MSFYLLAMPWVRREDYSEVRQLMADQEDWPATYDAWLRLAEENEQRALARAMQVVRVMIEPYEFDVWCAANGKAKDRMGRDAFAAENAPSNSV